MKQEPKGVIVNFNVTKYYTVSIYGDTESDCWDQMDAMDPAKLSEDDFVEHEYSFNSIDGATLW